MRLLLDTHVLIWALAEPGRLSVCATREIQAEDNAVFVSVASPWEIAIKKSYGNLNPPDDLATQLEQKRFGLLQVSLQHTRAIEALPHHHRDPFDRMMIAQAQVEGLTIVTSDRKMLCYQVAILPAV